MATLTASLCGWNWLSAEPILRIRSKGQFEYSVVMADCGHQSVLSKVLDRVSCEVRAEWVVSPWIVVELTGLRMVDTTFVCALEKIADAHASFREAVVEDGGLLFVVADPLVRSKLALHFPGTVFACREKALEHVERQS